MNEASPTRYIPLSRVEFSQVPELNVKQVGSQTSRLSKLMSATSPNVQSLVLDKDDQCVVIMLIESSSRAVSEVFVPYHNVVHYIRSAHASEYIVARGESPLGVVSVPPTTTIDPSLSIPVKAPKRGKTK